MGKLQIDATVFGFVQGVSFRYYTQREAIRLGVRGWVANQKNGTVRVVAQGSESALNQFVKFLHQGSPMAEVEQVEVKWVPLTEQPSSHFHIRYR